MVGGMKISIRGKGDNSTGRGMTCWLKDLKDITCESYRFKQGSHMLLTVMLGVHPSRPQRTCQPT